MSDLSKVAFIVVGGAVLLGGVYMLASNNSPAPAPGMVEGYQSSAPVQDNTGRDDVAQSVTAGIGLANTIAQAFLPNREEERRRQEEERRRQTELEMRREDRLANREESRDERAFQLELLRLQNTRPSATTTSTSRTSSSRR